MRTAVLSLTFFLCAASVLWAGEGKFEVRAVALHPGPPAREYLLAAGGAKPEKLFLEPEILLDNTALLSAEAEAEPQGWVIRVILSSEAKNRVGEITAKFLERRLERIPVE